VHPYVHIQVYKDLVSTLKRTQCASIKRPNADAIHSDYSCLLIESQGTWTEWKL